MKVLIRLLSAFLNQQHLQVLYQFNKLRRRDNIPDTISWYSDHHIQNIEAHDI